MQLINDIHEKTNKTIIIVEHRIEDVLEQPFDKVVIIDKGVVKGVGTPNEILKSDLLTNSGLREPLYVEAMKLAGCDVSSEDNLRDINSINEENKEILKSWFKNETSSKTINKEEKIGQMLRDAILLLSPNIYSHRFWCGNLAETKS